MQNPSFSDFKPDNGAMPTAAQILDWLVVQFGEVTGEDPASIDVDGPLAELGLGSVQLIGLVGEMEDWLDRELPGSLLWDFSTLREVASFLAKDLATPS